MALSNEREFIEGLCRNEQHKVRSHMYEVVRKPSGNALEDGTPVIDVEYTPMCGYGWNRSGGKYFSIFRGNSSNRGTCQKCLTNIANNKPAVADGWKHKTKWL